MLVCLSFCLFCLQASTDHDPQIVNNVSRTMSLTLSILSQMVDGFIHCYETEMKQWSGREKPYLSGEKYNLAL